jgi:hypothetical protein
MNNLKIKQPARHTRKIASVVIYDCDGVLFDSTQRYKTMNNHDNKKVIDLDHWRKMSHLFYQDKPLTLSQKFRKDLLVKSRLVIIATAREFSQSWVDFINAEIGEPDALVFRNVNCSEKGAILKISGIKKVFENFKCQKIEPEKIKIYEDNAEYLKTLCDHFGCKGEYVPSQQGY